MSGPGAAVQALEVAGERYFPHDMDWHEASEILVGEESHGCFRVGVGHRRAPSIESPPGCSRMRASGSTSSNAPPVAPANGGVFAPLKYPRLKYPRRPSP